MTRAENARNRNPLLNDYCLGTKQLAAYLGCNPTYMHKMRADGKGPAYHVIGGRVLYRWRDVEAWMDMHKRHTAESISRHTTESIETENDGFPRARGDGSSITTESIENDGFPRARGDGSDGSDGSATSPAPAGA